MEIVREVAVQGNTVIKFVNMKVKKIFASCTRHAVPVTAHPSGVTVHVNAV